MSIVRLVTPPSGEPFTLDDAKDHLRLDTTQDDKYVTRLISVARRQVEGACWRGILEQRWELTLPGFRGYDRLEITPPWRAPVPGFFTNNWLGADTTYRFQPFLDLERGHLANSPNLIITYLDESGNQQTLDPSVYLIAYAGTDNHWGRVFLNPNSDWPNTIVRFDAVKVTYTVGWPDAASVPEGLIQAMFLRLADLYENRTPVDISTRWSPIPLTAEDALIDPYRFVRL